MKNCAYCGHDEPLTKEHIWPRSLIEKYEILKAYNPKNNKFHDGEPTIKDVCANCNNGNLSKIDTYLSSLYDKYFFNIIKPGENATFEYDYNQLLRALLKISYNSARASNEEKSKKLHSLFKKYILEGTYCPPIMMRLQIVTASKSINMGDGSQSDFIPQFLRCGTLAYNGPLSHRFLVRLLAINSYWFYIIIPYKVEASHKWNEFLEGLYNWKTPLGLKLELNKTTLNIPVNKTTYMHSQLLGSLLNADLS